MLAIDDPMGQKRNGGGTFDGAVVRTMRSDEQPFQESRGYDADDNRQPKWRVS